MEKRGNTRGRAKNERQSLPLDFGQAEVAYTKTKRDVGGAKGGGRDRSRHLAGNMFYVS